MSIRLLEQVSKMLYCRVGNFFLVRTLNKFNVKVLGFINYSPFPKHSDVHFIIDKIGKDVFDSYFSFGFVRNSWDWQVSVYKYILKSKNHENHKLISSMDDFEEYIKWRCADIRRVRFQRDFLYSEEGKPLVDFVGRFENLNDDFQKVCNHLGINTSLGRKNVSNTVPYQENYNEETKKMVEKTYKRVIDFFGFKF